MNLPRSSTLPLLALLTFTSAGAQTLYVPGGTVGTSANGNVGIGTMSPAYKLDVAGDVRSMGNLIEKKIVFTPTAVGWYRIVSGAGGAGLGQAGGTIRTIGTYDGGTTSVEFVFNIRGWGQGGTLTLVKNTGVNGNIIDQARVSTDGGGNMYLDVHISTATAPAPITIYGYGPDMPAFVASPVVGATAGSTNVRVLPIGWSVGAYDDFRTTGNMVTYSNDGSTPQGYIYHGSAGQAAFGNGVTNGETWITRTGGAGSIKLGDYDLNTAYLTIAGGTGNVGIGTTSPNASVDVWKSYAAGTDSLRFSFNDGSAYWMGIQPYVVGAANVGYKFRTNNVNSTVDAVAITGAGNVGIGTLTPTHRLSVNGTVRAKEVIVDTGWSDYVFDDSYRLAPLSEVETHIRDKKHLPGIPSAAEVAQGGISLGDMQARLLAKVEELTLHAIEQEKRNNTQQAEIAALRAELARLESALQP